MRHSILVLVFLFWLLSGVWSLVYPHRTWRLGRRRREDEADPERRVQRQRRRRLAGAFWAIVGAAGLTQVGLQVAWSEEPAGGALHWQEGDLGSLGPSAAHASRLVPGHRASVRLGPCIVALDADPWEAPAPFAGAGGLRSTARDMLRFLEAAMGRGPRLASGALELAEAMGLGWIRLDLRRVGQVVVWHNGGTGGHRSVLGFTEDGRAGVALLSNGTASCDGAGFGLLAEVRDRLE